MTVDFAYQVVNYIIAKNLGQGNLNPNDFNNLINFAQYEFLDYLLGEFQSYQGGRPVSKVQFGMNESVRQRLTPFIKTPIPLTIDSTGLAMYPDDYQQMDAMYTTSMNRIRFVPQHKLYSYLNSKIDPITSNPIYLIEELGFRFYPNATYNIGTTFSSAILSYVGTPPDIKWAFVPDTNGRPVYDPGNSVDPEWYDVDMEEILARVLRKCGVSLQNQEVNQISQEIKIQGQ